MASAKDLNLRSLFSELNRACSVQAYGKVILLATKILSKSPTEYKALQCYLVALIRTEKYEECLGLIKKYHDLSSYVLFEKAYAEYRLNRIDDAVKTLKQADPNDLRVLELKAQVLYRKEEFTEAYTCLRQVIRNSQDDFGEERLTNLAAVAASAACFKNERIDLDIAPEMHEAKFNLACLSIGKGDDSNAQSLLEEAEIVCRRVLRDDPEVTEDDINEELAPIRIQQAFLLQRAKKEEEANQIYQSVTRNRNADSALLAVAANNIVCINREQNIFDSRKRIKMASLDGLQHKLFAKQREEMLLNQALFYWHTNQMDACQAKVKHVFQSNPHSSRALLLSITQLLREKQYSRAITLLQNDCSSNKASPDNTDGPGVELSVLLALAQLYLRYSKEKGQFFTGCPRSEQALSTDEFLSQNLPTPLLHSSGIVCTRIALHLIASSGDDVVLERKEALLRIADIIQSALDWYESIHNQHPSYGELLEHCATFLLQQGQASLAARLFERQLDRLDASSSHADEKQRSVAKQGIIARLVSAYAQFDPPKAELACRTLKFSNQLTEADVDSLETVFLYGAKTLKRHGRTAGEHGTTGETKSVPDDKQHAPTSGVTEAVQLAQTKNTHRKKKRRVRLPKNYQPGVMPDPDRWLPRRERANYRGKRRDKRYQPSRGPQGQVSGVCEWDASVRSPKVSTTVNPPVEGITSNTKQVSGAARQQQRKGRRKGGR